MIGELFKLRQNYDKDVNIVNSQNLWTDQNLYGKIDQLGNVVSLNETNLKQLNSLKGTIFCIDFVCDAFEKCKTELTMKLRKRGYNIKDVGLSSLEPEVGWISLNTLYHYYMQDVYLTFFSIYLQNFKREYKIIDFTSFVDEFLYFLHLSREQLPICKSSFVKSNKCPNQISGIIIELKKDMHDDEDKKLKLYNWKGFNTYRKALYRYGFSLNKNNPFQLIFNIMNPKSKVFMDKYGVSKDDLFISYFYQVVEQEDLEVLASYLQSFYTSFVSARPYVVNKCSTRKRDNYIKDLQSDKNWWLKVYGIVKYFEGGKQGNFDEIKSRVENALILKKSLDIGVATKYIES